MGTRERAEVLGTWGRSPRCPGSLRKETRDSAGGRGRRGARGGTPAQDGRGEGPRPPHAGLRALRREAYLLPQPRPRLPDSCAPAANRCLPAGLCQACARHPSPPRSPRGTTTSSRGHQRRSDNTGDEGRLPPSGQGGGSAQVRARRAENSPQFRCTEISARRTRSSPSSRHTETRRGPVRASQGAENPSWSSAQTGHTYKPLPPQGAEIFPGSGRAEISSQRRYPQRTARRGPEKGGDCPPPPFPALLCRLPGSLEPHSLRA